MENKDFFEITCPECKEKLFAAKKQEYWFCGYCGKKINLADADDKKADNDNKTTENNDKTAEKKVAVIKKVDNQGDALRAFASKGRKNKKSHDKKRDNREKPSFNKPIEKPVEEVKPTEEKPVEKPAEEVKPTEEKLIEKPVEEIKPTEEKPVEKPVEEVEPTEEKKQYDLPEFQVYLNHLQKYNGDSPIVMIPNGVTIIDEKAFKDNKIIQKVNIPNTVIAIGASAFEGCSSLTDVSLPNGLKKINYMTFSGCDKLKSLTIPASVDEIMFNSMYCNGLREITFKNADTRWEFDSTSTNPSFMVDTNDSGKGVNKIFYDYTPLNIKREYEAKEIFKSKTIRNYFKAKDLCPNCGGTFGGLFTKKCKDCGAKKGE